MSRIAVNLDQLRKNLNLNSTQPLNSFGFFSAEDAESGAGATILASYPFEFRARLGSNNSIAYCDNFQSRALPAELFRLSIHLPAALPYFIFRVLDNLGSPTCSEDHITKDHYEKDHDVFEPDTLIRTRKVYDIQPKSIFSAFHWLSLALTTLRLLLLMNYIPLLVPLVALEKRGIKDIVYEISIVTIRRLLEKLAVYCFSQQMAWKLIKDASESAKRKAQRGMSSTVYFGAVTRTTFRAHCLGVAASWIVQVGIYIFKTFRLFNSKDDIQVNKSVKVQLLLVTLNCTASLVFAAILAGLGAALIHPSLGQWIGCAAGNCAGPVIVGINKLLHTRKGVYLSGFCSSRHNYSTCLGTKR